MSDATIKLSVIKLGCIGTAPLLDLLFDERADRADLDTRGFTSGAKLDPGACEAVTESALAAGPDLVLIVSPNAVLPGPTRAREICLATGKPVIAIGDSPSKKAFYRKNDEGKQVVDVPDGLGFFIMASDPMLGARREFLDTTEMALFNADVIKVLAATGILRLVQSSIDAVIEQLKTGEAPSLPRQTCNAETVLAGGRFSNAYAASKAFAALKITESIAAVTGKACFAEKDPARYVAMAAGAHEMLRAAAGLAAEAREMEKAGDALVRTPHANDGTLLAKRSLHPRRTRRPRGGDGTE